MSENNQSIQDEYWEHEEVDANCWQCGGEGSVMWGCDIDIGDPFWDPGEGEVTPCPCCRGSGNADDCLYW